LNVLETGISFTSSKALVSSEIKKMFNCGINAFLAKPLNIGKLYTALSMFMDEVPMTESSTMIMQPKEVISYEGIDIQKGIRHANNNEALYQEVLKEFNVAYEHSDELFVKLVDEHRFEQIRMLCVDMRGLAGTIGADDMQTLVTMMLQHILYKKYELISNYKEKYIFELKTLKNSIKKYIDAA